MLGQLCASRSDDGNVDSVGNRSREWHIETLLRSVAIDRRQQDFACTCGHPLLRPLDSIETGAVMPTADPYSPATIRVIAFRVDRQNDCLSAEFLRKLGDELGPLNRGCVDRDFVCAGANDGARIFERANAAARGERNRELGCYA